MKYSRLGVSAVGASVFALAALVGELAHGIDTVTPPPNTLWKFLGIPQNVQRARDAVSNRFGNRPWMERRPPVLPLAHPANLESQNPAIKRAAEIKAQQDLAPQKIKAIKYLASIGCGCYDKDGSVTAALVAALEDCTPEVREAVIEAIIEATQEGACAACNQKCCCNEDLVKKLAELAYEKNDEGCWLEPNAEVREAAKRALAACCPGRGPLGPIYEEPIAAPPGVPAQTPRKIPVETPERPRIPIEEPKKVLPLPPPAEEAAPPPPFSQSPVYIEEATPEGGFSPVLSSPENEVSDNTLSWLPAEKQFTEYQPEPIVTVVGFSEPEAHMTAARPEPPTTAAPAERRVAERGGLSNANVLRTASPPAQDFGARGTVAAVDSRRNLVRLQFESGYAAPVGATVAIYHEHFVGRTRVGRLQVVQSAGGVAVARPVDAGVFDGIHLGDTAVFAPGN